MKTCAFLSMDSLEGYFVYDDLLYAPMAVKGWHVERVSWRAKDVDWARFDVVVIRSPWDYQQDAGAFLRCLEGIDASGAMLANSLALVRWNINKGYLRDIQQRGIAIVPSLWRDDFHLADCHSAFEHFACDELIIKPLVSANADDTYRLNRQRLQDQAALLAERFAGRAHMIQPFVPAILQEGEYSLFFFGTEYSHCIVKRPKAGDFRVQEEHGGYLQAVEPEPALLELARQTLAALPEATLYARLDYVRLADGLAVMELELIEPSLYFNMDAASPQRFVDAFVARFG
ncbi:ATP-grasp domain protein [Bowmanella denitrificans]|uniref:ATP-grasp domain protein n=1 Tax=Bowmanella denitrificans TaxID=366582 RepID=A0ABN0XSB7_9ALTE